MLSVYVPIRVREELRYRDLNYFWHYEVFHLAFSWYFGREQVSWVACQIETDVLNTRCHLRQH